MTSRSHKILKLINLSELHEKSPKEQTVSFSIPISFLLSGYCVLTFHLKIVSTESYFKLPRTIYLCVP